MDDTEAPESEEVSLPPSLEKPKERSGNPNPKRPNPDSVGESISNSKTSDMMDG